MPDYEEVFEKIAQEAISKAEAVRCPFGDFVEGLHSIKITVTDRLQLALDEQRQLDGEE